MPKSKEDVQRNLNSNEEKYSGEAIKERAKKETKGKSGRFSGLGERDDK